MDAVMASKVVEDMVAIVAGVGHYPQLLSTIRNPPTKPSFISKEN